MSVGNVRKGFITQRSGVRRRVGFLFIMLHVDTRKYSKKEFITQESDTRKRIDCRFMCVMLYNRIIDEISSVNIIVYFGIKRRCTTSRYLRSAGHDRYSLGREFDGRGVCYGVNLRLYTIWSYCRLCL